MLDHYYKNSTPNKNFISVTTGIYTISFFLAFTLSSTCAKAENWHLNVSAGQLSQNYKEIDTYGVTANGILDSETGSLPTVELGIIKKLTPIALLNKQWTPYGKLQLRHASGDTDYDGYLQYGIFLQPYKTKTDNKVNQADLDMGMSYQVSPNFTITPHLSVSHHRWKRELEQYTENFRHTAVLTGTNIDWQPNIKSPISLQFQVKVGKIMDSNVKTPDFDLDASIGKSRITQIGITGIYEISNYTSVNVGVNQQRWDYDESNSKKGFTYPSSNNIQKVWLVGLTQSF